MYRGIKRDVTSSFKALLKEIISAQWLESRVRRVSCTRPIRRCAFDGGLFICTTRSSGRIRMERVGVEVSLLPVTSENRYREHYRWRKFNGPRNNACERTVLRWSTPGDFTNAHKIVIAFRQQHNSRQRLDSPTASHNKEVDEETRFGHFYR